MTFYCFGANKKFFGNLRICITFCCKSCNFNTVTIVSGAFNDSSKEVTFLIVLFVLMMQFLWLYIDELVGKGLSLGVIFEFLGWGSATLFPLALPLATLLASIMTMGSFGENNELLAMVLRLLLSLPEVRLQHAVRRQRPVVEYARRYRAYQT